MENQAYYNTTGIRGEQLLLAIKNNLSQNETIKAVFQSHPDTCFTAYDIIEFLKLKGVNYKETSVRRAMTQLKDGGYLVETDQRIEKFNGHPNKALRWKQG